MHSSFPADPTAVLEGILRYLHEHPEAADSLEGIASWWLPQFGDSATIDVVQEAVAQLVLEHRIACIHLADGRTLYQSVAKVPGSPPVKPPTPRRQP